MKWARKNVNIRLIRQAKGLFGESSAKFDYHSLTTLEGLCSLDYSAHEGGLACVLKVVGDYAHEPHSQGNGWIPRLIDNSGEVVIVEGFHESERLLQNRIVITGKQFSGFDCDGGHIIR